MDILENHLKGAYAVEKPGGRLAITETSCYHISEETGWLIEQLPAAGVREEYLKTMADLGIEAPGKIFDRLMSIGVLREKKRKTWRDRVRSLLTPRIKLFPAGLQERIVKKAFSMRVVADRLLPASLVLAAAGLIAGASVLAAGTRTEGAGGMEIFLLVVAGSLLHELGHSFAAAVSGIGFRPIGFSVYLIYPVFYTNVSGIDKLGLKEKVLIDCGGFIFQLVYVLSLLVFWAAAGSPSALEAARWTMLIMMFNLNPLLRTDGYWLYKDVYAELKDRKWARAVHHLYVAAFFVFSAYFIWLVGGRLGGLWRELAVISGSPRELFSGGHRLLLGAYFILLGFYGGLQRFKEGRQEWAELKKTTPAR